ncbi:MAG: hypothetical protein DWI58_06960 [Chloroflexi bacterium]|nr:MAG: hypothetical protein DWI58_06960 [Chloroflexota bacterium]
MDRSEALRHRLLQMLASRMEREQSDLVDEIRATAGGGAQELSDAMTRWEGRLGERQRPESAALGAIFDLDLGMDHLLFAVEGVEAAKDPRTLWVMADMVTVYYFAALERMGDLAKRFQRSGLIDDVVSGWVSKERAFRSDAPILEYRHEVAHSAQHSADAVRKAPERAHLWELMALLGGTENPFEMTYLAQSPEVAEAVAARHREGFEDAAALVEQIYARIVDTLDARP